MDRNRRKAALQSLPDNESSEEAAKEDARRAPRKKSKAPGNIGEVVAAVIANTTRRSLQVVGKTVMTQFGHLQPAQLSPMMANALIASWKRDYRPNTCWNYRHELKLIIKELQIFGAQPIELMKAPKRQRATTATISELAAILRTPPPFLRLYMLLYFQCGLRHSETLRVTPRTWDSEHHTVTVQVKGGGQRTVLVSPDVEALLVSAGDPEPDTPFLWTLRGHKMSGHSLSNAFIRHKQNCGVNPALTAHDLRRTAATILYTATKDLRVAQELLGHKNITSTLTYLAPLHPDDARKYSELLRFEHFKSEVKQ